MTDTLSEFYNGKSILLTGAAGFIGTIYLNILLRCFPRIVCIYILLRPRNGVHPQERKKEIFAKKILRPMSKSNPELVGKVQVIAGDTTLPNLGMNEYDLKKVSDEVTIVFHGAAIVSFTKSYRDISLQNAKAVNYVIELCRKLKKLDVLVHTSTAYANCHVIPETILEKIYLLPFKAQRFLDEMENGTDKSYDRLVSATHLKWLNSYCFSKCLAENILMEKASDLPVGIVRPSIVFSAWKGTLPGCVEEGSGMVNLSVGVGKGFVRVVHGDTEGIFDVVPVDVVVNAHIVTGWSVATGRSPSMFVVNCTSGSTFKLQFGQYIKVMSEIAKKNPIPRSFQEMSVTVVKSKIGYTLLSLYEHYIPAVVLDIFLRFQGSKLRLVNLYRFFDKMMEQLHPFASITFSFQNDHFYSLSKQLNAKEREMIYTDLPHTYDEMVENLVTGSDIFNWDRDKLSVKKRRSIVLQRTLLINLIKRLTLLLFLILVYLFISKLYL